VSRPLPAFFFRTEAGREPVREWLRDLPKAERRIIGEDIMTVQFRWPLGMPLVDSLGSGLWEIRSKLPTRVARILFFVHDEELILLHGFIKKTKKTPPADRALALQRKNTYVKIGKEAE
jgi:phage-related protein